MLCQFLKIPVFGPKLVFFTALILGAISPALADTSQLWDGLKSGDHLVVMRHALAPGTGDPGNFSATDCSTQRNLSDIGKQQANHIGELFKTNGISSVQLFSSQWCRCMDTATEMNLGPVESLSFLNSFFRNYEKREPQTRQLEAWINQADLQRPTVLVTHQVNITALTGVYPASGELVFLKRQANGGLQVVGRLTTKER